jgi:hypothetical protein
MVSAPVLPSDSSVPGEVVPMPTLLAKYAFPVVVAPPAMVNPPVLVPLPIVEEAKAYIPWVNPIKVLVALAVAPPKVVGVKGKIEAREEEETLLLKVVQSVEVRRPRVEGPEDGRLKVSVPAEAVMPQSPLIAVEVVAKVMAVSVVVEYPEPRAVMPPKEEALIQVPPMAKQPVRRFKPEPKVEVAIALRLMVSAPVLPSDSSVPGEVVPMPTLLAKYAFPVVVAPPAMVNPPVLVPLPIVLEARL